MLTELIHVRPDEHLKCDADPFGASPMFVGSDPKGGAFVSRSQRELRKLGVCNELDPRAIRAWLMGDSSQALIQGLRRVPPGASVWIDRGEVKVLSASQPQRVDTSGLSRRQLQTTLLDELGAAVDRAIGDRKPACLLSGGLDSAGLLLLIEDRKPRVWTLVSGPRDRDLKNAVRLARDCGLDHQVVEAREDELPDAFEAAVKACEIPIFNGRSVASYLLYEVIGQAGDEVVLSGIGADEVLMGEPARLLATEEEALHARHLRDQALVRKMLLPEWAILQSMPTQPIDMEQVRNLLIQRVLPAELSSECRSGQAHGVEVLMPYLDHTFASFALGIPADRLIEGPLGKMPLREAWAGTLPDEVRLRPKYSRA